MRLCIPTDVLIILDPVRSVCDSDSDSDSVYVYARDRRTRNVSERSARDHTLKACVCIYFIYIHTYIHTYIHLVYICVCVCVSVCMYVCMYVYTHKHTHTHGYGCVEWKKVGKGAYFGARVADKHDLFELRV
jgi:hypothetical protein